MPDLLLLGLIGALTLLLLLTLLAFAGYSGLLTGVTVSAGSPPIRNITLAYKFHVGPYGDTGQLFTESCSISPKLRSIAVYYDNPQTVPPEKCRCAVGSILSEGRSRLHLSSSTSTRSLASRFSPFQHLATWSRLPSLTPPPYPSGWPPAESILLWMSTSRSGSCVLTLGWRSTSKTRSTSCAHWHGKETSMCQR